jgi:hypothetical protein
MVLIILAPVVSPGEPTPLMELFFDLVLLAGVASISTGGTHRLPFGILTLITLVVRWADIMTGQTALVLISVGLSLAWVSYAIFIVVPALFRERDVTLNTLYGAAVAYLLIAVAFTFLFGLIEFLSPGAFSGMPTHEGQRPGAVSDALLYFSLTSVTTMGYGDIVPVHGLARSCSVLEGAIGQLYLAVMIARLVGLHLATEKRGG